MKLLEDMRVTDGSSDQAVSKGSELELDGGIYNHRRGVRWSLLCWEGSKWVNTDMFVPVTPRVVHSIPHQEDLIRNVYKKSARIENRSCTL